MTIPDVIKNALESMSDQQADEAWEWLDGNPDAIEEMINCICDSHPELVAANDRKSEEIFAKADKSHVDFLSGRNRQSNLPESKS